MAYYRHLRGSGYLGLEAEPPGTGSPDAGRLPADVRRGTGRTVRPLCPVCEALDSGVGDVSGAWDPFHFAVRVDRYVHTDGKMIFTVLAAVAELERSLIRERVQMGVDRARR